MIMEHFDLHKEQLEDVILDLHKEGAKTLNDLPARELILKDVPEDVHALLDEVSGLTAWLDGFMTQVDMSEQAKENLRSMMHRYEGKAEKTMAMNEIRNTIFGGAR